MSRFERWSRLKRGELSPSSEGAEATLEDDTPVPQATVFHDPDRETEPESSLAPGSLDHTLPDPDTLPAGSDIKAYLASGVSAGLRKRALRRLFAGDHYGLRDGLDDYDDDYRQKLQPLASEVAERLRNWTRGQWDEDETPAEPASEASASGEEPAMTGQEASDDDPAATQPAENQDGMEHRDEGGARAEHPGQRT